MLIPKSVLSVGLVIAIWTPAFCQPHDTNVRVIEWDPMQPLISRLTSDDRVVIVEKHSFPPGMVESTSDINEEIANLATTDLIVVGEILNIGGSLIDGGSWIEGHVAIRVQNSIKSPKTLNAAPGATLTFSHLNGQTTVKGVEVRAGSYPAFRTGSRYLLFLNESGNGTMHFSAGYAIRADQTLNWIQMFPSGVEPPVSTLLEKKLADVIERVVSAARRQQQR